MGVRVKTAAPRQDPAAFGAEVRGEHRPEMVEAGGGFHPGRRGLAKAHLGRGIPGCPDPGLFIGPPGHDRLAVRAQGDPPDAELVTQGFAHRPSELQVPHADDLRVARRERRRPRGAVPNGEGTLRFFPRGLTSARATASRPSVGPIGACGLVEAEDGTTIRREADATDFVVLIDDL